MFRFWKENSKVISRLILFQVGAAILGVALTAPAIKGRDTLLIVTSVLSVFFYLCLLYAGAWEAGGSDRIRIDGGRAEMKPFKGLFLSLCANLPNLIFAVIVIPSKLLLNSFGWARSVYSIFGTLARFYQGMYIGVISELLDNKAYSFILIILPAVAVTTFAYYMGVNNKRVFGFVSKKK